MPPSILTTEDARAHVAEGETQTDLHAANIADATAQHSQWLDSRPFEEKVASPTFTSDTGAVLPPPEGGDPGANADTPPSDGPTEEEWRARAREKGWTL